MKKSIRNFTNEYDLYLQDESRKTGYAETVSFPKDIEEAASTVKYCCENDVPVTVRSGGTGVGAGAVPFGGHLMSMEKIKGLKMGADGMSVIAGAGCSLNEINRFITINTGGNLFLPPDPTEGSAGAGGMVSCNSSGARTYMYGPVRNYVKRLTIILSDGKILDIERGKIFASGRNFEINGEALGGTGKISGKLPGYIMPKVKNAAGYYICDDMDLIDIFIGSEGTLGIVAEAEFSLIKKPENIWGIIAFFRNEENGIDFSEMVKGCDDLSNSIMSVEFFDQGSLELLREKAEASKGSGGFRIIPSEFKEAVFTELKGEAHEDMILALKRLEDLITAAGGNPDDAWCAVSGRSFEAFKELRHATPEGVNNRIAEIKKSCPAITKLGSDMSVPGKLFKETVKMYKRDLENAGLEYVMFGHIGDSHLHVNIISRNEEEYFKGKEIFAGWAEHMGMIGGSISAEHGVGKLKREFLVKMYGEKSVDEMRELKRIFDPKGLLGRDNIFLWDIVR
ncbi:MAG: FAD-binding oxidoreductase [Clostridiales bacterium]|nr:FAD-binding oxidoreductase [Clostridiales bacterium]